MPGKNTEQDDPEERADRDPAFVPLLAPEPHRPGDVRQRQGRRDHDGSESRLRQVPQQTRNEDEHQRDRDRADDAGDLGLRSRLLGDRGPRPARADGEALEETGGQVRRADADHLLAPVHFLARPLGEGRRRSDRVGERDEGDARSSADQERQV
jgi:hypothetical protein